jgi:hypothetical protein
MEMSFQPVKRVIWGINRLLFFFFALMGIITAGVFCQLLAPLYSWYFFKDLNFTRYYRYLFPIISVVFRYHRDGLPSPGMPGFLNMFAVPLFAPPMLQPESPGLRVNPSWGENSGDCRGCVQCCIRVRCPMLDQKAGRCLSYGSFFYRYFNCGRYPVNQFQIDHFQCPKWFFPEEVREGD